MVTDEYITELQNKIKELETKANWYEKWLCALKSPRSVKVTHRSEQSPFIITIIPEIIDLNPNMRNMIFPSLEITFKEFKK